MKEWDGPLDDFPEYDKLELDDRTEADLSMWWTIENGNPCGQFPKCSGCGTLETDCLEFQKWYESGNYKEEDGDVAV